jgi:hypothetical protein
MIEITITGLTQQQRIDIGDAFDETIGGPMNGRPEGMTKARWVEVCLIRHIKAVVVGWKRGVHETAIAAERAQIDSEYPEV